MSVWPELLAVSYSANVRTAGNVSRSILNSAPDLLSDLKDAKVEQKEDLMIASKILGPRPSLPWLNGGPQLARRRPLRSLLTVSWNKVSLQYLFLHSTACR